MVEIFLCILNDFISVNNVPKSLLTLASDNFWIIVWIMPKIVKAHSNKIARLKPSLVKYDFLPVLTSFAASFVISKTSIFTKKTRWMKTYFDYREIPIFHILCIMRLLSFLEISRILHASLNLF